MFSDYIRLIFEKYRTQMIISVLVLSILGILFLPRINFISTKQTHQIGEASFTSYRNINYSQHTGNSKPNSSGYVYVDIKGAVKHPGAYQVDDGQRVGNVIQKAGGYTDDADTNQVNLAQKINDQMIIYIPRQGERIPISNDYLKENFAINSISSTDNSNGKVNLNLATVDQLKGLTGIGEKKAQKIIEYRQQHGQFKSVEELKNVNGFGEKSIATLANQVCV